MIRLFRHYVPLPLLLLALIEALVFMSAIPSGRYVREWLEGWDLPSEGLFVKAFAFALVMVSVMTAMGLYERNFWNGKADMMLRVAVGFLLGLFATTLLYYVFPDLYLGRGEFGIAFGLAFAGVVIARIAFFQLFDHERLKRRVLVLGCGHRAAQIERLAAAERGKGKGFKVIGYVRLDPAEALRVAPAALLVAEPTLGALCERLQIDEIVVAMDDRRRGFPVDDILECKIGGVVVTELAALFERETGKIHLDALHPSSMIFSDGYHQAALMSIGKRLLDIGASAILLALSWPIMVFTAIAIRLESSGPIFYRQARVGRNDRVFDVIKFRSMRVDAEQDGRARWAQHNDSRITRVGAFIRKARIDELPQLFNVLRGDMSFVGPRPERPQFVAELAKTIPYYTIRHRVNPGITGWAQICYPYGASVEDAREKLQYDLYYIKNYSLFLDFMVLLQTAHVILWGRGAR